MDKNRIKTVFESHANVDTIYCVSDGTIFLKKEDAEKQKTVKPDVEITPVTRTEFFEVKEPETELTPEQKEELEKKAAEAKKIAKETAENLLKETKDISTIEYDVLKKLCVDLELTTANKKAATLIQALTEVQLSLKQ